jgi:hypothetical protein
MHESQYISNVHKRLDPSIYRLKVQTLMNNGVPDAYYSTTPNDMWIEYKYIPKLPKRPTTYIKPKLSDLQLDWLTERRKEGRRVLVVIGSPAGAAILEDSNEWISGVTSDRFSYNYKELANYIREQLCPTSTTPPPMS